MSKWNMEKWAALTAVVIAWALKPVNEKKHKWATMDVRTYVERGADKATTDEQRKDLWARIRATGKGIEGYPVLSQIPSDLPQFLQDSLEVIGAKRLTNYKNRFMQELTRVCEIRTTRPKGGDPIYYQYENGAEYATNKWASEQANLIKRWKTGDWDGTMKDLLRNRPDPKESKNDS